MDNEEMTPPVENTETTETPTVVVEPTAEPSVETNPQ